MFQFRATLVTTTILNSFATVFVFLRAFSRFHVLRVSSADDYLIVVGLVLSWCLTGLTYAQVRFGLGRHLDQVSPTNLQNYYICFYIFIPLYNIDLTIVKLSALFQFLRFFTTRGLRITAWSLIAIVSSYGIAVLVASLCSCLPVQSFWIQDLPGMCIEFEPFWYFNSSFNVVTDFAVVALPLYVLKDLHLPRRQKLAVIGVFAVGFFTCVTSIIRLYSVSILIGGDSTYDNDLPTLWSAVEVNTAIICACMQSLKPLIQKFRPRWLPQRDTSSNTIASSGSNWKSKYLRRSTGQTHPFASDTANLRSIESTHSDRSHQYQQPPDELLQLTDFRL